MKFEIKIDLVNSNQLNLTESHSSSPFFYY